MRYRVHITKQHPAWDERDGMTHGRCPGVKGSPLTREVVA